MAIGDDFEIDRATKTISVTGTPVTTYTVLEFHRWLQNLADDATASGDDELDITDPTPSDRSTDNIITLINDWVLDESAGNEVFQYLYDGSIAQTKSGDERKYAGLVVVGNTFSTTELMLVQAGSLLNEDALYGDLTNGFWGNGINSDAANNILSRMLVKVQEADGDLIDGGRVTVMARELGDTYAEFTVSMGDGNNVAAIFTAEDLNNATAAATIEDWGDGTIATISNTEGYRQIDITGDGSTEDYYSEWNKDTRSLNDLYEYTKWAQRRGQAATLYGMEGQLFRGITHQIPFTGGSGAFTQGEEITWGTDPTDGAARVLAHDGGTTTGTLWVQLTKGTAPSTETMTGGTSGETATSGSVTSRTISPAFIGQSTGTNIIGAYGVGIEVADVGVGDKLFDLTGTLREPQNTVTFTVFGLEDDDYVLVTNNQASAPDYDQFSLQTSLTADNITAVVVTGDLTSLAPDTPKVGTLRVQDDDGFYRKLAYDDWNVSTNTTFDITSTDGQEDFGTVNATAANNVFASYVDAAETGADNQIAFSTVYDADRTLFIRVRHGADDGDLMKTFETTATLGSSGGSTTCIRTADA